MENSFITNYADYAGIQYYMKNNSITDFTLILETTTVYADTQCNKTIDGVSKVSSQWFCLALNTTLYNIIIFIYLNCNLALTRLYICIELYHAKSK